MAKRVAIGVIGSKPKPKKKRGGQSAAAKAAKAAVLATPLERTVPTTREILFAEQWMIDHNAGRAYRDSNDKPITKASSFVRGSKMLAIPRVRAYIEKVEAKLAEHTAVTKAWTIQQATRTYTEAFARGQYGSATQALQLVARLNGQIVEPQRTLRVITSVADLTDEELAKLAAGVGVDEVVLAEPDGETRH